MPKIDVVSHSGVDFQIWTSGEGCVDKRIDQVSVFR